MMAVEVNYNFDSILHEFIIESKSQLLFMVLDSATTNYEEVTFIHSGLNAGSPL
jgi:hypothetical protein